MRATTGGGGRGAGGLDGTQDWKVEDRGEKWQTPH